MERHRLSQLERIQRLGCLLYGFNAMEVSFGTFFHTEKGLLFSVSLKCQQYAEPLTTRWLEPDWFSNTWCDKALDLLEKHLLEQFKSRKSYGEAFLLDNYAEEKE